MSGAEVSKQPLKLAVFSPSVSPYISPQDRSEWGRSAVPTFGQGEARPAAIRSALAPSDRMRAPRVAHRPSLASRQNSESSRLHPKNHIRPRATWERSVLPRGVHSPRQRENPRRGPGVHAGMERGLPALGEGSRGRLLLVRGWEHYERVPELEVAPATLPHAPGPGRAEQHGAEGAKLFTVKQTSELLSISPSLVYRLKDEGKLPAYRIADGEIRFREDEVLSYLESCRLQAGPRTAPPAPKNGRPFTQLDGERFRSAWRR